VKPHAGALIRIGEPGAFGYADIHPWPELGDESLEAHFRSIVNGRPTNLAARALALAADDREARMKRESSFHGLRIPENHFLATDLEILSRSELAHARGLGFKTLKLKAGRAVEAELAKLRELAGELIDFRLRFDFNSKLTPQAALTFHSGLPPVLQERVEFFEDPIPWSSKDWFQLQNDAGVPLALDRGGAPQGEKQVPFRWLVVKPAVQDAKEALLIARQHRVSVCVTSSLDHPVGQSAAAIAAGRLHLAPHETCGLLSHRAYEKTKYSEMMSETPQWKSAPGYGLGFDDLLAREAWKTL
jgi:O-succinylbenzoate synthase